MQTKLNSIIESTVSTAIGLLVSFITQLLIYPIMNIEVKLSQNIIITLVFTVVSILRGYFVRRFFNKYLHNNNKIYIFVKSIFIKYKKVSE